MRNATRLVPVVLAAGLMVAACTGGGDDAAGTPSRGYDEAQTTTTMASTTIPAEGMPAGEEAAGNEAGDDSASAPIVASVDPIDLGRSIVYTATLEVEVDDVVVAGEQVRVAMEGIGGLLFGQETTTGPEARSVLTIKVRPEDFQEALSRLSGIGTLISQEVSADDVTERIVDLESRITTAEASVARLRAFLEEATDLADVATLENELLRRETDLELLRGQLRTLENQVALATIVLILSEPAPPVPEPVIGLTEAAYFGHDGGAGCPGADEIEIDEGEPFTVCYVVTNSGNTALSDVEVRDSGLDARPRDMLVVEGDPEAVLPVGGRVILAFEADAEYPSRTDPVVTATAVDDDGEPLRIGVETEIEYFSLEVIEDTSLPGFGDALASAWGALQTGFGVVVMVAGAAVPFLWVPILLAAGYWWTRRRRTPPAAPPPPEASEATSGND